MRDEIPFLRRFFRQYFLLMAGLLLFAALSGCQVAEDESPLFPRKPIKVIVPFAAGGGSDSFGRVIQSAIDDQELLPRKLVIINVPGAGGTIGSRRVKNCVPDGYTILLLHEGILSAKYSGKVAYGPEAFAPIIGTGKAPQIIAVADSSPFTNLSDLMDEAAKRPDQVIYAANIGAPSHFAGLMLEQQQPGAVFRFAQTGGGAKRFEAIKGGHVDVSSFSLAEYAAFRAAGLRALAVLSEHRHQDFPDLPTAAEQGFDVVSENTQYWWAPRDTPTDKTIVIAEAIEQAMQLPDVQEKLASMRIDPITLRGDALQQDILHCSESMSKVATRELAELPNLPAWALGITVVFGIATCWRRSRRTSTPDENLLRQREDRAGAAVVLAATASYALLLQSSGISFIVATAGFVLLTGNWIVSRSRGGQRGKLRRLLPLLSVTAVLLAVGIHVVFTRILVVDLP